MTCRALIFDLDGTLLDSLADIGESMNFVLKEMGLGQHILSDYRAFVGDGMGMLARRALPPGRRGEADVSDCVERMRAVYSTRATRETRPYEGIEAMLDAVEAAGIPKAVLSNKPHPLTVDLVKDLLGKWQFAAVLGERPGIARKPDPTGALEIAAALSLAPRDILYVGDTPTDMATALAAGMPSVGVTWGFRSEFELREAGAVHIARRPSDLIEHAIG
ncbi:MAG: HAD family hydrolase [Actinobacteria bacterium]|nr:HAD family hydrolase [Actinomycetota bacterium]